MSIGGPCPPWRRPCAVSWAPSFWTCKALKPNFQSIIFQTNNDCNLLSPPLAKLLLLDISCENIFALSLVTALTACPFSIKKCPKMSVFLRKNLKNSLAAGCAPPLSKSWVYHSSIRRFNKKQCKTIDNFNKLVCC